MFEIAQIRICIFFPYVCVLKGCTCEGVSVCSGCAHMHVCNENQMAGRVSAWFLSPISNQTAPWSTV